MIDGISIVICCHNSEERIPKVLQNLLEQEYDSGINWEVLLIDNASKDRTSEVARELWDHPEIELRTIDEPNPGLSNARQKGLAEARFEIVSLIDDDNWVEKHWVEKVYRHMAENPNIGILGGRGEADFEEEAPAWFTDFQDAYAVGPQAEQSGRHYTILYGAGLNIRKSAWEHLKSNNFEFLLSDRKGTSLSSGGDSELCLAALCAGYELYYDEDLRFVHQMPAGRVQWDYLIKLQKAFGRAAPVANIYFSFFRETGFDKRKHENTSLAILNAYYNFFMALYAYAGSGFSRKEGSKEYLKFVYCRYSLKEQVRLLFTYRSLVDKIREAKWRSNHTGHA